MRFKKLQLTFARISLTAFFLWTPVRANQMERYEVEVDFKTGIQFEMGDLRKSHLEREVYFRSYGNLGAHSPARNNELMEIGAPQGRGTAYFDFKSTEVGKDVTVASQNDATSATYDRYTRTAQYNSDNIPHALANGRFPEWMVAGNPEDPEGPVEDWELQSGNKILRNDLHLPHAESLARMFDILEGPAVSLPHYYSPINEPPYTWDSVELANYHVAVANAFTDKELSVKVTGPCSAWPYPLSDFRVWENRDEQFLQVAGGAIDAYDFHFYSKGNWALPQDPDWDDQRVSSPSLYESQRMGVGTVWDYGRLEGYLDLLAATHQAQWGEEPLPVIVSEFGRQSIYPQFGPWENDFKPWLYMTTVIRQWMTYWKRPEIRLTIPFIMSESNRNDAQVRGQAIYNRPDGTNPEPTRFREFYPFFRDISGDYISYEIKKISSLGESAEQDIRVVALRNGSEGYLVLHNAKGYPDHPVEIDLSAIGVGSVLDLKPKWKRLYYEGEIPAPHSDVPLNGELVIESNYQNLTANKIQLSGESTAIIQFDLAGKAPIEKTLTETKYLSEETLIPVDGLEPLIVFVELPNSVAEWESARVEIGIARDGGFSIGPCVSVNGQTLGELPVKSGRGVKDWHAVVPLDLPIEALNPGMNEIKIQFSGFHQTGNPKIVTTSVVGKSY